MRLSKRGRAIAVLTMLSTGAACAGTDPGVTAPRSQTATTVAGAPSTSQATTVDPPSTTTAATTQDPTSTLPVTTLPASPWHDVATMPSEAFPPCCASNWLGTPSPALPEAGPIPDGIYNATRIGLSADQTQLTVEIRRYEACAARPDLGCEPLPDGYEYQPDELGLDPDVVRSMTVTLDGTINVALVGWETDAVLREATGTELAELLVAVTDAYQVALATPLVAGADADAIVASLVATPALGFGPPPVEMFGTLLYTYDGAPPLLFQAPFDYRDSGERLPIDPTMVVSLNAIQFSGGVTTLYFFAGYYP